MEASGEEMYHDVQSDEVRPSLLLGGGRSPPNSNEGEPDYGLLRDDAAAMGEDDPRENPNLVIEGEQVYQPEFSDQRAERGTMRSERAQLEGFEPPSDQMPRDDESLGAQFSGRSLTSHRTDGSGKGRAQVPGAMVTPA